MLTITDFIQVLHKYYKPGEDTMNIENGLRKLEQHKISTWREIFRQDHREIRSLVTIDPIVS
jgi:hypothetical protein